MTALVKPRTVEVLERIWAGDYSAAELRAVLAFFAGFDPHHVAEQLDKVDAERQAVAR